MVSLILNVLVLFNCKTIRKSTTTTNEQISFQAATLRYYAEVFLKAAGRCPASETRASSPFSLALCIYHTLERDNHKS